MAAKSPFLDSMSRLGAEWLAEYRRGLERYAEFAGEAVRGTVVGGAGQAGPQRLAEQVGTDAPRIATRIAEAGVNYYARLARSWTEATTEFLEATRAAVDQPGGGTPGAQGSSRSTLLFWGTHGDTPVNGFVVANTQQRAVEIGFRLTELTADDGGSPVAPEAQFTPATCRLEPGAEQIVRCTLPLSESFRSGVVYRGRIEVIGFPDMSIGVSVEVEEASAEHYDGPTATQSTSARRKPAAKKKTTTKKKRS